MLKKKFTETITILIKKLKETIFLSIIFVLCVGEKIGRAVSQHQLSSLAHLADERRSGCAKATDENEYVGHAVARAVSKGGSAEGVFAGAALAGEQVLTVGVVRSLISV